MEKIRQLEMRILVLEKTISSLLGNPIINDPDKSAMAMYKMEAYQEMKRKFPDEIIEYTK